MDGFAAPPEATPVRVVIGRRWLPWRSTTRRAFTGAWQLVPDWGTGFGDDPVSAVLGLIVLVVTLPFMIPALLITPFFLAESILQWLVLPFAVLARAAGWVPVEVDVRHGSGARYAERVAGWGAARARMRQIAAIAGRGGQPPYAPVPHRWAPPAGRPQWPHGSAPTARPYPGDPGRPGYQPATPRYPHP
ncbi:hypothetical protein [Cumulibacter manganitolerans]|uniref:hypothetical protein n=1 Tax=Cumulibacter manganitolerans TaxID=1884992 RepID=UPI00129679BD|nr:hypothetical protein [Cumulibacter manganitolerans]